MSSAVAGREIAGIDGWPATDVASVLNSETAEDDDVLMTITEAGILVCALCDRRAVARLTTEWLCADHVLIELAARTFDDAH